MTARTAFRPISVSHLGYPCDAPKRAVAPPGSGTRFVLQDLGVHANLLPVHVPPERKLGLQRSGTPR